MRKIAVKVPMEKVYFEYGDPNSERSVILLHGYNQSAESFYNMVKGAIPIGYRIIVPNGLFLVPTKNVESGNYKVGFSWYFYNLSEDKYYTDYAPSVSYIGQIMEALKLEHVTLLGYSQGGYLAPVVGGACSKVKKVICVNASYRQEFMPKEFEFQMTAYHGSLDMVVGLEKSQKSFNSWVGQRQGAKYQVVDGAGHRWDQNFEKLVLQELLS